ncbi:MAG: carbohydrate ABC transporter permease [Spirochaetaceae bacterium]|jgi:putative aldouronate transport system permease protein|nr:carbohydrate ABC transporter permease [Spirochaetaceae bacterium]
MKKRRTIKAHSKGEKALTVFFYTFVTLFALMCLYPLVLAFSASFSTESAITASGFSLLPRKPTLDTFTFMLSQRRNMILLAYRTSIIVTLLGTAVSVIVTAMYAYVVSVPGFKHANKFAFFAYFTMLFNGGMLPWYILCTRYYGLQNTLTGLIIPYAMNVFNMFLMRNYLRTIPASIYESARIDGAGNAAIFFSIIMPLSQIGLVTIALFYALSFWNDFYLPLMLLSKDNLDTLQYMLYRMMSNIQYLVTNANNSMASRIQPPLQTARMAMSVLAIGPVILVYPFVQKYFVKGIIIGAVKG